MKDLWEIEKRWRPFIITSFVSITLTLIIIASFITYQKSISVGDYVMVNETKERGMVIKKYNNGGKWGRSSVPYCKVLHYINYSDTAVVIDYGEYQLTKVK